MQFEFTEPNLNDLQLRVLYGPVFWKQRHLPRSLPPFFQYLNRPSPALLLAVFDLSQIQHLPLNHPSLRCPMVLDNAPIPMLLAIFQPTVSAQEHGPILYASQIRSRG
jgi:hypothetical protein